MNQLPALSPDLERLLREARLTVATAESCTTGCIAASLGQVAGASAYLCGAVVAYATELKTELLGVPAALIARHHVVSEEVARAMASGVSERLQTDLGIASTGLAGPGGAEAGHPVGMVCLAVCWRRERESVIRSVTCYLTGDRETVIRRATEEALRLAEELLRTYLFTDQH